MTKLNLKIHGLKMAIMCISLFFYTLANSQSITINNYKLVSKKTFPTITDNLSGVTYNNETKTLFMVQNQPTNIYETSTNGNIIRTIKLNGFDDTEGIIHISGTQFAVAEEKKGRIVFFTIEPGTTEIEYDDTSYAQLPNFYGPWGANNGLEGLTYNRVTNQIVTLKEFGPKGYFAFDLPTSFPAILSVADVKIPCSITNAPFNELADLAGIHHQGTSAMIISQQSKLLKQLYGCGAGISLSLADLTQPEGITFANDTLYIVGEPNELAIYSSPCVIGSACDDGDDCTENDQYDEACRCVGKPIPACGTCQYTDSLALVNIYQSFNGNFWDLSKPMDTWKGVTLNENGCVTELELNENLRGELSSAIGDLKELTYLELSDNYITGNIPSAIGNLTKLKTLKLDGNNFDGPLPSTFGNLQSLEYIQLQYNNISEIPTSIGNLVNLKSLSISYNQLANLPSSIGNLINLNSLILDNNILVNIPDEIGNLNKLTSLGLSSNLLKNIPSSIGNLNQIEVLSWNNNQITEQMPEWLSGLNLLRSLSIQNNEMRGCYNNELNILCDQLTPFNNVNSNISDGNNFDATWEEFCTTRNGSCKPPPLSCRQTDSLALITIYQSLRPNHNWDLSTPIDNWPGVKIINENGCVDKLDLSERVLWGVIPPQIGDLSEITYLGMVENIITGSLPPEIGKLTTLKVLSLGDNKISGPIPNSLKNLVNLEILYLSQNQFTEVPLEIANFEKLTELYLSKNLFKGCYPSEFIKLCNQLKPSSNRSFAISDGNNFDASWEDFCAIGNGSCKPPPLSCRQTDSLALITIYQSLKPNNNWDLSKPVENWPGVRIINENGCVDKLDLSERGLSGVIPPEIGDLSEITFLRMVENEITGFLPAAIGNLTNLKVLSLADNNMSGSIPGSLKNLTNLEALYLSQNQFTDVPLEIGNFDKLTELFLSKNQLSGCYPSEFLQLCDQLIPNSNSNFAISDGNNFNATWEDFCAIGNGSCENKCNIDDWTALKALYESTNGDNWVSREGWDVMIANQSSPPANCDLSILNGIGLNDTGSVNSVTFFYNNLEGFLPNEISQLSNLENLWIIGNSLTGAIPSKIGELTNLKSIMLYENKLDSSIPKEIGKLTNLMSLGLNNNNLSGNIPAEIADLQKLEDLFLYENQLTGEIPTGLSKLTNLVNLFLADNQLNGCYDNELKKLCNQVAPTFQISITSPFSPYVDAISYSNNFDISWEDFCAGTECLDFRRTIDESNESYQSYNQPNPFTKQTSINYTLSENSRVTVSVYNSIGKRIAVLHNNEAQEAGNNTVIFRGDNIPAGVYYYRISSNNFDEMKKMVLIK